MSNTQRACLRCISRKRKCDHARPTCKGCKNAKETCEYPPGQLRRGPLGGLVRTAERRAQECENALWWLLSDPDVEAVLQRNGNMQIPPAPTATLERMQRAAYWEENKLLTLEDLRKLRDGWMGDTVISASPSNADEPREEHESAINRMDSGGGSLQTEKPFSALPTSARSRKGYHHGGDNDQQSGDDGVHDQGNFDRTSIHPLLSIPLPVNAPAQSRRWSTPPLPLLMGERTALDMLGHVAEYQGQGHIDDDALFAYPQASSMGQASGMEIDMTSGHSSSFTLNAPPTMHDGTLLPHPASLSLRHPSFGAVPQHLPPPIPQATADLFW